jgi:16S rRNA (adenine1518-N6/adenine1519-N6)-dimethyltransferase
LTDTFKKSLGQHFLKDENVCRKMISALLDSNRFERLLEIGPGGGALTKIPAEPTGYRLQSDRARTTKSDYPLQNIALMAALGK